MAITHCPHCDEYVSDRITICPKCKKDMLVPCVDKNGVERTLKRESLDFPPILQKCVEYYEKKQAENPIVVALYSIKRLLTVVFLILDVLCTVALFVYGFAPAPLFPLAVVSTAVILISIVGITVFYILSNLKSPVLFIDKLQDWMSEEKIDPYEVLDAIHLIPENKMEVGLSKQNYHYALTAIAQAALLNIKKETLDSEPTLYKKKALAGLFDNLSMGFLGFLTPLFASALKFLVVLLKSVIEKTSIIPQAAWIIEPYALMPCFYVFAVIGILFFIVTKALYNKKNIKEQEAYRQLTLSKWMKEDYKKLRAVHFEGLNADGSAPITK